MGSLTPILQMSVTGSFLFIITCIFKPFTNKNFSATWNYYMLVLTLLVFIIPIGTFVKLPSVTIITCLPKVKVRYYTLIK